MFKQKILILGIFVFILLALSQNAIAAQLDSSLDYSPRPAQAGDEIELEFTIENTGSLDIENITFMLDIDDPFILSSSNEKFIEKIEAGEDETLIFKIYVQGDANEGTEEIDLKYKIGNSDWEKDSFDIEIAPKNVYLRIKSITTNPEKIAPGKTTQMKITLENTANSKINDVVLKLDIAGLPFSLNGVTEQHIGSIDKGEDYDVVFNLNALSDAKIQTYKIPVKIDYYDNYGNNYSREDLISVEVFETPNIEIVIEENKLILGVSSDLTIKILNKGLSDVGFVEAKLLNPIDYKIQGKDSEYIGNIESDDYDTIDFKLTPNKQNMQLQISLTYRDSNNKEYNEIKNINVKAYTLEEAQAYGFIPSFPWFIVIVVLVIVAVIIFFIVRRKRKKKELMGKNA